MLMDFRLEGKAHKPLFDDLLDYEGNRLFFGDYCL